MAEGSKPAGFLARYGGRLIDAGYEIIPILRGTKRPRGDNWENIRATKSLLKKWLAGSAARDGVGILTRLTPGVDIDIQDEELGDDVERFVRETVGHPLLRVGRAPKRLLLFRCSEPFAKVTSAWYVDPWNPVKEDGKPLKQRIEILGDGQQFVAYAIHPDTRKPYVWLDGEGPLQVPAAQLPEITREQAVAIAHEFERLAEEKGWTLFRASRERLEGSGRRDFDDPFADVAPIVSDLSDEELERRLLLIPTDDADYELWFQVGMALYHQYEGADRGKELWHLWSQQSEHYDPGGIEEKWPTFDIERKGRAPITARYILQLAKEAEDKVKVERFAEIRRKLSRASDEAAFRAVCDEIKHIEFDKLSRAQLVSMIKERFKSITGATLQIGEARDLVRYENPEVKESPWWIDGWVYCEIDETFFHLRSRKVLSKTAFNDSHSRHLLTKKDVLEGRSSPEQAPSAVALNLYQIPVVRARMYMPGEEAMFDLNGVSYANSYDDRNVPEIPAKLTAADRQAVALAERHLERLFVVERDRAIFLHWLAFIVQNPGKRLNWMVLIQGVEGDGKTFFFELLATVLAWENVRTLVGKALEEKNTAWAEGSQVVFVEELKLAGHNRHDVLNAIKPMITNRVVAVRRMNVDWYDVLNVTNYIAATNFRDALPLTDSDSRYFMLFSRFQTKSALASFKTDNPGYFRELYGALEHAGALRKWLLEHELPEDFSAMDRAPDSAAKAEMIRYAKSEEAEALDEILAESPRLDMTELLLNASDLPDEMSALGVEAPYGRLMNKLLLDAGFTSLGKVRVDQKNSPRMWSRRPDHWIRGGSVDTARIRRWLSEGL